MLPVLLPRLLSQPRPAKWLTMLPVLLIMLPSMIILRRKLLPKLRPQLLSDRHHVLRPVPRPGPSLRQRRAQHRERLVPQRIRTEAGKYETHRIE